MAKKLENENYNEFWKEVKVDNNSKVPLPCSIDGVSGRKEIADLWKSHVKGLLNSVRGINNSRQYECKNNVYEDVIVSKEEIGIAISRLESGKSCGMDGVSAEHLKYCSDIVLDLLALCFTKMFVHGFIPDIMLAVFLCQS